MLTFLHSLLKPTEKTQQQDQQDERTTEMAKRYLLSDDIDGSTEDIETVKFGLDGMHYEIDLSAENRQKLADELAPYITAGRREDRRTAPPRKSSGPRPANQTVPEIRRWAKDNGFSVPDRGRLPKDVVAAWEVAHAPHSEV